MARYKEYDDDTNPTVNWIPGPLQDLFGLDDDYRKPKYGQYDTSRSRMAESTTSWVPGFIRRWLGLEYSEPKRYGYGEDESYTPAPPARSYSQPATPPVRSYTPASPSTGYSASTDGAGGAMGKTDYNAPRPQGGERMNFGQISGPSSGGTSGGSSGGAGTGGGYSGGALTPGMAGSQPDRFDGYVKPITYGARMWVRGALPPQGLEEFTKQLRKTTNDVTGLYSDWTRFQFDDVFKAFDSLRRNFGNGTNNGSGAVRRVPVATRPVTPVTPEMATPVVDLPPVVNPLEADDTPPPPNPVPPAADGDKKDDF